MSSADPGPPSGVRAADAGLGADDGLGADHGLGADDGRTVVTIGVFDGVHLGHQQVVAAVKARADALGLPAVVVTFDPHPSEVVRPGTHPSMLTSVRRRVELLRAAGADAVVVLPFTKELSLASPEEFVQKVLVGDLHVAEVVVGSNFRFGHRASGTVDTLRDLGATLGFTVDALDLQLAADASAEVCSSTAVRSAVAAGDVERAAELLGRPHALEGTVIHGDHRGRELGYPTANLQVEPAGSAVPAHGVYAGWLVRGTGERLPAAISVGTNPTFDGQERRVESYVLDHDPTGGPDDLDLYGEEVLVEFAARLRPMLTFTSVEDLVVQMAADTEQARALLG